jgi:MoxR-like ATPase
MKRTTAGGQTRVDKVLSGAEILELQSLVRKVPISDEMIRYVLRVTRATRISKDEAPEFIREWLAWGAGPRASQYLILGAKARAVLRGRTYVAAEDIQAIAHPVLRHRILTNFSAEAEGITADTIIDRLIAETPVNESGALKDGRVPKVIGS